jgi:hypothetical protein
MNAVSCQMPVLDQNIMCNQFTQVLFALGDDVSSTTPKFIFPQVPLPYAACIGSVKKRLHCLLLQWVVFCSLHLIALWIDNLAAFGDAMFCILIVILIFCSTRWLLCLSIN